MTLYDSILHGVGLSTMFMFVALRLVGSYINKETYT